MDVRIGIADSGQVIDIDMPDDTDRVALKADVEQALTGHSTTLWLTDKKGHETGISAARITFVEVKNAETDQRIGFGA